MLSYLWKWTLLPFFTCDPLCITFNAYLCRLWVLKFVTSFFPVATEEKKSLKRTFQQIQEEEDDDYPGSYSPQDPSAGPLLVCLDPQRIGQSDLVKWPLVGDSDHKVAQVTNTMESPKGSSQGIGYKIHPVKLARQQAWLCLCVAGLWHGFMFYSVFGFGIFFTPRNWEYSLKIDFCERI